MKKLLYFILPLTLLTSSCAKSQPPPQTDSNYTWNQFSMGVDLSYVNAIEDAGGKYFQSGQAKDAFTIMQSLGANTVRVRIWHNPQWLAALNNNRFYSDLYDAEKTIRRAKALGMAVNLDFHYSDDWADPAHQNIPAAWQSANLSVLKDSVYQYTLRVLNYLAAKNLTPEMVQVGNETNGGMLWPIGRIVNDQNWSSFGQLINSGVKAVRDFAANSSIKPKIILHVAQIQNTRGWIQSLQLKGSVADYDILGISHYYKWSDVNNMNTISDSIRSLRNYTGKDVMIVETAFPWTNNNVDNYNNMLYQTTSEVAGYAISPVGQAAYLRDLTQAVITGGGKGVMYWEPAWITSNLRDPWGVGSTWDNATFFDFRGNLLTGINYMKRKYTFPR